MVVKKKFPDIRIISFFHNIEFDFRVQCKPGIKRLLYLPAILSDWMNERWAIRYSDVVVVLHKNDSFRSKELYGRKADFIHPICIANNKTESLDNSEQPINLPDKYILFVGSAFSPNLEAVKFLCNKVMPALDENLIVIGSNMENYRKEYSANNVLIIGSVSDLKPYYDNAKFVVTPIFTGAGMKVKVAEALMYGKCVLGSRLSFIGYESAVNSGVCMVADSADEYISMIRSFNPSTAMELKAKEIFAQEFSVSSGNERIKNLLQMAKSSKIARFEFK
jgi:glycosyltransferase involved in cell wall biosynthesis